MIRAPPNLAFQEKSPSFHGSTLFGYLLFFLPKLWLLLTLFEYFWQVMGASLKFSPREFLPFHSLVLLGMSWATPLICGPLVDFSSIGA